MSRLAFEFHPYPSDSNIYAFSSYSFIITGPISFNNPYKDEAPIYNNYNYILKKNVKKFNLDHPKSTKL